MPAEPYAPVPHAGRNGFCPLQETPMRIPATFACLGLLMLPPVALSTSAALAEPATAPATITVSGEGTASATPDMAELTTGVVSQADDAAAALKANSAAMEALVAAVRGAGIAGTDISTSGFSVQPRYTYPGQNNNGGEQQAPKIVGYEVRNAVTIKVRDMKALGPLLDSVVVAGANDVGNLTMTLADTAALADKARRAAIADARKKAEAYAEAAGVKLGRVLRISEQGAMSPRTFAMPVSPDSAKMMSSVPVEAGELDIRSTVDVAWEIAP